MRVRMGEVIGAAALVVAIAAFVRAGMPAETPSILKVSGIEIVGAAQRTVLSIRAAGPGAVFFMSEPGGARIGLRVGEDGASLDLADGTNGVRVALDGDSVTLSATAGDDPTDPVGAMAVLTPTRWTSTVRAGGAEEILVLPRAGAYRTLGIDRKP